MKELPKAMKFLAKIFDKKPAANGRMIILTGIHTRTFPRALDEFTLYIGDACPYLFDNSPRLISVENCDALHVLFDDGTVDHEDWKVIREHTKDPIATSIFWTKKQATRRHEIEQLLLQVYEDVPESVWTEEDRTKLRQPKKAKKQHHARIMEVAPEITEEERMHLGIKLHFQNPETPDSDAMPDYQHILLEYFIGDKDLKPEAIVFGHGTEVTRHLFLIYFDEKDSGKTIYFRCRYVNTTGKPGKTWSKVLPILLS